MADSPHSERPEKPARESKKDESSKRERLRNKVTTLSRQSCLLQPCRSISKKAVSLHQDRPAIQLYQPGARSRNRTVGGGAESTSADTKPDPENNKVAEKGDD